MFGVGIKSICGCLWLCECIYKWQLEWVCEIKSLQIEKNCLIQCSGKIKTRRVKSDWVNHKWWFTFLFKGGFLSLDHCLRGFLLTFLHCIQFCVLCFQRLLLIIIINLAEANNNNIIKWDIKSFKKLLQKKKMLCTYVPQSTQWAIFISIHYFSCGNLIKVDIFYVIYKNKTLSI